MQVLLVPLVATLWVGTSLLSYWMSRVWIPIEGYFFVLVFSLQCKSAEVSSPAYPMAHPYHYPVMYFVVGCLWSGFERFAVGYMFHFYTPVEPHEDYHERLRRRKGNLQGYRAWSDDVLEIVGYLLVMIFLPVRLANHAFWFGWLWEHWLGFWLRTYVQYVPSERIHKSYTKTLTCQQWKCRIARVIRRFAMNADLYYGYHLVRCPVKAFGFSTPFWDYMFGYIPAFGSTDNTLPCTMIPFPFIDFFVADWSTFHTRLIDDWKYYETTDNAHFKRTNLAMHAHARR